MQPSSERSPGKKPVSDSRQTALCLALLLLAGAEFVVRGPVRAIQIAARFNDFLSPYIQAEAWLRGLDPYSPQTLLTLWPAGAAHLSFLPGEVADGSLIARRGIPTAYPITSLVLLAPLSVLSWNHAYELWLALNLALFLVMLGALVALAGVSYRDPPAILLAAATLALAPFHTGIVTGNVALIAVELGVVAVWMARQRHQVAAAVMLAVSAGLKPQIGLCFLLYYLVRRRWRVVGGAAAGLGLIAATGLLRLQAAHTAWLANYLNDSHILLGSGILSNFTAINPTRYGLVNLQVALYPLAGSIHGANIVAWAIGVILMFLWLAGMRRTERHTDLELLELSTIAVISLLPFYHRFYDAALLVLPLCWIFVSFRKDRRLGVLSLLLMLPFAIPGGTLLETMQANGRMPLVWASHWWWETMVMPHQVWMLLFLSALLLYEMLFCSETLVDAASDEPGG